MNIQGVPWCFVYLNIIQVLTPWLAKISALFKWLKFYNGKQQTIKLFSWTIKKFTVFCHHYFLPLHPSTQRQSVVYLVHPTDSQLTDWLGLFGSAFALKFLEIAHMIFLQCIVDVFFIDWERPRGVVGNSADTAKTKEVGTGCRGDGRVIKL